MALVLVLFASRGVAAAYPPDPAPDAEASSYVASLIDESVAMALPIRIERAFLSNAVINGTYAMRACIVNFRTSDADVEALPEIIAALGRV